MSSQMGHPNKDEDLDGTRSWVVAISCCFCNLILYGISRLSGLMLVTATHTFGVSRAAAALPFSLSTALRSLAGVFVGHLGHRFGVGPVVAIGCALASLGSGLCYFAKDILWITLCWGGLFGIGFGLSTCLLPLAINQHFKKHTGTASGISYSGAYIGSFIFSPVVVWLIDTYGLQGTFLVISAAILNLLAAALFLKKPKSARKSHLTLKNDQQNLGEDDENHNVMGNKVLHENVKYYLQNNGFLFSEVSYRHKKLLPNIFKHFQFESSVLSSCQIEKCPKQIRGIYLLSATNLWDDTQPMITASPKSTKTNLSKKISSQSQKSKDKKLCRKYKVRFEQKYGQFRIPFKERFEDRHRTKLYKIKKLLSRTIIQKKNYFRTSSLRLDDVKLTSYKCTNSFPCCSAEEKSISIESLDRKIPFQYSLNISAICDETSCGVNCLECKRLCNMRIRENRNFSLSNSDANNVYLPSSDILKTSKDSLIQSFSPKKRYQCTWRLRNTENSYYKCNNLWKVPNISKRRRVYKASSSLDLSYACNTVAENYQRSFSKPINGKKRTLPGWVRLLGESMFVTISFTMSLHTFIVVSVVTTIEDFAKDLGIHENKVHFILMALSVADLVGSLSLGFIMDRAGLSRHHFLSICFLGMSLALMTISLLVNSLPFMLSVIVLYGLLESGVIITFPIVTKQFVEGNSRQAIAIAFSNVLSAPTVMLVPMLIGHFRENIGSYSGLFHLLAATSFTCCLVWLVVPSIHQKRKRKRYLKNNC